MSCNTPELFERELEFERQGKGGACDDTGALFLGTPRDRYEHEYLSGRELDCMRLRRHGKTLREIGALVELSTERVRCILSSCIRKALRARKACVRAGCYHDWWSESRGVKHFCDKMGEYDAPKKP